MKRLICICVAVCLLAATPVMAMTGNELKHFADEGENSSVYFQEGFFMGYVVGVGETTMTTNLCPPKGVINTQIEAVVRKYLKDHPEKLHLPASGLVTEAIQAAWPCKK